MDNAQAKQVSEFEKITCRLENESNGAIELSKRIMDLVELILPFDEQAPSKLEEVPLQSGIIGTINNQIDKVRIANLMMENTLHQLQKIVG